MKKILIATGIFPPDIGGPATMLNSLADGLIQQGFEVRVITYSQKKNIKDNYNFEVIRIKKDLPFKLGQYKYYFKLGALSIWSDVIYTTDTYSVGFFTYLIKKKFNKKYILRFTGDSAWETARSNGWTQDNILDFQSKPQSKQTQKIIKRRNKIMFNADQIIVDCEFNKKLAIKIGVDKNKIHIIPNVSYLDKNKIDKQKVQNLKNKYNKIILTSGRLTNWKGVDTLIKIIPQLVGTGRDLSETKKRTAHERSKGSPDLLNLLILGDGPQEKELKKITHQLGLEKNVHFLGRIPHSETINYFAAADVFVLNSQYEGCSHAILDALKLNIPVIASNSGGNPEIVDNKFLVNYNNQNELLNKIKKVLNNEIKFESRGEENKDNIIDKTVVVIQQIKKPE